MDALDAVQLDVGGRRGAGDEGDRPPHRRELPDPLDRLRDKLDDLLLADHADVQVGHEAERTAALGGASGQHDRAGLGDRDRRAGEDAVDPVERGVQQCVLVDQLDLIGAPGGRQAARHGDPLRPARGERLGDRLTELGARNALHRRAVVADPLAEEIEQRRRRERAVAAIVAREWRGR